MEIAQSKIIYIAHRLFALHDRGLAAMVADRISKELSDAVFLPYCDTDEDTIQVDKKGFYLFKEDIKRLHNLNALVAILHGPSYDDGTCMEVGFAYGKKAPLIFLLTDFLSYSFGNEKEHFNHPDPLFSVIGAREVKYSSPLSSLQVDSDENQKPTYKKFYYRNLSPLQSAIDEVSSLVCQTSTVEDLYIDSHFPDISKIKQLYIESSPYSENSIFDHIICEALEMGWSVYEASRFRIGTTQSAQNDLQEALRSKIFLIDGNGPEVPPGASFLTGLGLSMNRVTILYYSGTQTTTRSGGYSDLSDRIAQVIHPTLILWGKADDVLGTADATRWQRAISDSQLIWIEDAGHVPHFDQPQVAANHLLSFMQHVEH